MAFLTDKEELKPGLVIFRRGDVQHRNWYCRVKIPKSDRYKTLSLKTSDVSAARDRAYDHDADLRFRLKHDVPIFNRSFSQIAKEYVELQKPRGATGQVSDARWRKCESVIRARLDLYVGSTQIHLIGQDRWEDYPTWRRETSKGASARAGERRHHPLRDVHLPLRDEFRGQKTLPPGGSTV
jgi:integrase